MAYPEHNGGSSLITKQEPLPNSPLRTTQISGWALHHYSVVDSTNLVAARLAAWSAVRSDTQTAGRGRFQRAWVSDAGGLWLSAVVPLEPKCRRLLPLAMGAATIRALQEFGVPDLRMRWPNDVLVGDRKLAGLLIDQVKTGSAVVGIGINVSNQPEALDTRLTSRVARLHDLLSTVPTLDELTSKLLVTIRAVINELSTGDFRLAELNPLWRGSRNVRLELDHATRTGLFTGVDADGRLRLAQPDGGEEFFEPHQVRHLTETETDP